MPTRSVTVTPEQMRRIARISDRVDPNTDEVLDEHEAMERLVGLEATVRELDGSIAAAQQKLKALKEERENRVTDILAIIRIPEPKPTPLFDGEPQ